MTERIAGARNRQPVSPAAALAESIIVGRTRVLPTEAQISEISGKHGSPLFSDDALFEAAEIIERGVDTSGRERVQGVVFSLDSANVTLFEDAFSVRVNERGNYVVGVHAIDVAAMIPVGSALDRTARRRARTEHAYVKSGANGGALKAIVPMLPRSILEKTVSLSYGVERPTKSVELEYDSAGSFIGARIFNSVLTNQFPIDYEAAKAALAGDAATTTDPRITAALKAVTFLAARQAGSQRKVKAQPALEILKVESNKVVARALRDANIPTSFVRGKTGPGGSFASIAKPIASVGDVLVGWTSPARNYAHTNVQRAMEFLINGADLSGVKGEVWSSLVERENRRLNLGAKKRMPFLDDFVAATLPE
jgi:exoribonuclease II